MDNCKEELGKVIISSSHIQAGIFDLDGVITQTAKVHAEAWKEMFDEYLKAHHAEEREMKPFDIQNDYAQYVDGKPRYDGVKSFLESRGIDLPFGTAGDSPDKETICGLGNRKNQLFRRKIYEQGVEIYSDAVEFIHNLREKEIKTAVVSSSKNCADILEAAGLSGLFDSKVDGKDLDKHNLEGKPAPDIFLEAARRLDVEPETSVVFEDAISGIQAGRQGGFGCVVGVARKNNSVSLKKSGADAVISDFSQIVLHSEEREAKSRIKNLPLALKNIPEIKTRLKDKRLALFLDYDGTLTPIVRRPELAVLSEPMRETVKSVAKKIFVAVISGRDLADVKELVGIPSLCYAGSHGFDISGPEAKHLEYQKGHAFRPQLKNAEQEIKARVETIDGAHVESKKFSFAVHFREVSAEDTPKVEKAVDEVVADFPDLRKSHGKKVFEIQPDLDWDKGKALLWLLDSFHLNTRDVLPVYIGDDVTDEDAFFVLKDNGIGIVVGENNHLSIARYRLNSPEDVQHFLRELGFIVEGEK
ncbi:MAG: trehalose-phosphatase [Candidatus Aminicenantes bacterium]|jgi:alpha,alpha-trehalase